MAWLNTRRKGSDKLRREEMTGVILPECRLSHIVELSYSFGFSDSSWSELHAWKTTTGATVNQWELSAVRAMVSSYQAGMAEFDNSTKPSPIKTDIDQGEVADQVRAAMRG